MANTFTFENDLGTARDRVRFRSGDTLASDPIVYDETIAALLTLYSDDELAVAIDVARQAMLRYAREDTSRNAAGISTANTRYQAFKEIVSRLESEQGSSVGAIEEFAAGSSYDERETFELDPDFVPWSF